MIYAKVSAEQAENVQGVMGDQITVMDVWAVNDKCPRCRDDSEYFFYTTMEFPPVERRKEFIEGGYCCTNCGFANPGAIDSKALKDYKKPKDR